MSENCGPSQQGSGWRGPGYFLSNLLVGALLLASLFSSSRGQGVMERIGVAEVVLALAVLHSLAVFGKYGGGAFAKRWGALLPPVLAIAMMFSVYATFTGGSYAVYIVNLGALAYLFVPLFLLTTPESHAVGLLLVIVRLAVTVYVALGMVGLVTGKLDSNFRDAASSSFNNTNLSSAFAAASLLALVFLVPKPVGISIPLGLGSLVLLSQSFSFGAVFGLAAALAVGAWGRLRTWPRRIGFLFFVSAAFVSARAMSELITLLVPRLQSSYSFDKSTEDRLTLWQEALGVFESNPLGVGFGGLDTALPLDVHNDFLTYLAAFGLFGLVLLGWLFSRIWLLGGDSSRAFLTFLVVEAFTHDALSWRFLWLYLSIAFAVEAVAQSVRRKTHDSSHRDSRLRPRPAEWAAGSSARVGVSGAVAK